ncbi:MAG: ATP-binding protein [Alcanivoracaceae bacterium]
MFSIRRFLLLSLSLTVLGLGTLTTVMVYRVAAHEVEELFDAQLIQHGRLLARWLENGRDSDAALMGAGETALVHSYERYVAVQHVSADGELLFSAPIMLDQVLAPLRPGVSVQTASERDWHVYVQPLGDGRWLMVGEEQHIRDELSSEATLAIVVPFLAVWPLLALAMLLALRRGLRPLTELESALRERHAHHLAALEYGGEVVELNLVVTELNRLLAQIDEVLRREQRFSDDAAHELRTLLSILKLHADNAVRMADPAEREHALQQVQAGIARAESTVTSLLSLARLEAGVESSEAPDRGAVLLMPVIRQVMADMLPAAEAAGRDLVMESHADDHVRVPIRTDLLMMVVRNLIDNALRYSPPGSEVVVRVSLSEGQAQVVVEDAGAGLPDPVREQMGQRFLRGDHGMPGAGLGLSIARRVVEYCGGRLTFAGPEPGHRSRAVICLPVAAKDPDVV